MLTEEQSILLNRGIRGSWPPAKIKYKDGLVNVKGNINLGSENLTTIPFQFGYVTENFNCENNKLTSLKGCPYEVDGFFCAFNNLTSLEYFPKKVKGIISLDYNPYILNDKLFEDIKRIKHDFNFQRYDTFLLQLRSHIPIQFGVTDQSVIDEIWQSYMHILEDN